MKLLRFGLLAATSVLGVGCSVHTNQPHPNGAPAGAPGSTSSAQSTTSAQAGEPGPGGASGQSSNGGGQSTSAPSQNTGCPAGQTLCAGRCVNLAFDLEHCGACLDACATQEVQGAACLQGRCEGKCGVGFEDCNQDLRRDGCEVDLRQDLRHCGACNQACSGYQVEGSACAHGLCVGSCRPGFANCNGDLASDGCEVNLKQDPQHCGACQDAACAPGSKCQDGRCVLDCAPGEVECDGTCARLDSDLLHCGSCGAACASQGMQEQACQGGACTGTCEPGQADCNEDLRSDGCEVDTASNPDHCGACGYECSRNNVRTALCTFGRCKSWCEAGFDDCRQDSNDGCETQVHADSNNCGRCGFQCTDSGHMREGATCQAGACKGQCQPGYRDCNGDPLDACEAFVWGIRNCGGCGVDCVNTLHYTTESALCERADSAGVHQCGGTCQPKYGDCDGEALNGCEADLSTDATHCGACNNACSEGLTCDNGRCVSPS